MFTAAFVRELERELTNGTPLARYFDLVAGTSTGGIVAIGVGLELPADDIFSFYEVDGKKIFPPGRWYYPWNNSVARRIWKLFRPAYSGQKLEAALKCRFGTRLLGHSSCRLLIPSFMFPRSEIAVLKTDHHEILKRDWKMPAWKAARATSAAPTYFSGLQDGEKILADGGLWANNPIMAAVIEAYSCFDISLEQIKVLSVATGNPPVMFKRKSSLRGVITWAKAFDLSSFLSTDNFLAQAQILLGPDNVLRVGPEGEAVGVAIDDWAEAMATLPTEARRSFVERREDLAPFFEAEVEPWTRFYSQALSAEIGNHAPPVSPATAHRP